jgi:hypothetical protein
MRRAVKQTVDAVEAEGHVCQAAAPLLEWDNTNRVTAWSKTMTARFRRDDRPLKSGSDLSATELDFK